MKPILSYFHRHTYALLRLFAGAMFMIHGTQKVLNWPPSNMQLPLASMAGAAGLIELITGALVMAGLFTSLAAFVASGQMAVAYFVAHAPNGLVPNVNKGEMAVLYCFIFLYIAASGGGLWSLDRALFGSKDSPAGPAASASPESSMETIPITAGGYGREQPLQRTRGTHRVS